MAEKLKIIPLGGLDEIGKNMTVYEIGSDMIAVDCGLAFPKQDMLGIDLVIPDFSYLKDNIDLLKKFITKLNKREQNIITNRYGLNNKKAKTQKEIAKEMHISRSYVSRIEKRAISKILREFIKTSKT